MRMRGEERKFNRGGRVIICDSLVIPPNKNVESKPYFSDPVGVIARERALKSSLMNSLDDE